MFRGIIIKESLLDELILDLIVIEKVEIWKAENRVVNQPKYWTAITFNANSEEFTNELSKALKEEWYVDLGNNIEKIIVFKNKVIKYKLGDLNGKQQAIDYCRKIGVPESQIDWCE
jgi:hypothetical protein